MGKLASICAGDTSGGSGSIYLDLCGDNDGNGQPHCCCKYVNCYEDGGNIYVSVTDWPGLIECMDTTSSDVVLDVYYGDPSFPPDYTATYGAGPILIAAPVFPIYVNLYCEFGFSENCNPGFLCLFYST